MPHQTTLATAHPTWCDPYRCETTDGDRVHYSRPLIWHSRDARLAVGLSQSECPDIALSGPVEAALAVEPTSTAGGPVEVYFDAAELTDLIGQLTDRLAAMVGGDHE